MNNKNPIKIAHIFITGRVQGVSYRWWFQNEGEKRKLNGWVRNRTSNRVEAEITGNKNNIDRKEKKTKIGGPFLHWNAFKKFGGESCGDLLLLDKKSYRINIPAHKLLQ